jgi:hypothetical protein
MKAFGLPEACRNRAECNEGPLKRLEITGFRRGEIKPGERKIFTLRKSLISMKSRVVKKFDGGGRWEQPFAEGMRRFRRGGLFHNLRPGLKGGIPENMSSKKVVRPSSIPRRESIHQASR